MNDASPIANLALKIAEAREAYRPLSLRCLLIAEAPPDALDRFFYFPDVKQHDHLFLAVMEILYPEAKKVYLESKRDTKLKRILLQKFQSDGFWLLDVLDVPLRMYDGSLAGGVPRLIDRLQTVINRQTPVILIKASTYDVACRAMREAGINVVNTEAIPFPASGQQGRFRTAFTMALKAALAI